MFVAGCVLVCCQVLHVLWYLWLCLALSLSLCLLSVIVIVIGCVVKCYVWWAQQGQTTGPTLMGPLGWATAGCAVLLFGVAW